MNTFQQLGSGDTAQAAFDNEVEFFAQLAALAPALAAGASAVGIAGGISDQFGMPKPGDFVKASPPYRAMEGVGQGFHDFASSQTNRVLQDTLITKPIPSVSGSNIVNAATPGLAVREFDTTFVISGRKPGVFSDDTVDVSFNLYVAVDGQNIRDMRIGGGINNASLLGKDLQISFDQGSLSLQVDRKAAHNIHFEGKWDPAGPGEIGFTGRISIKGDGEIRAVINESTAVGWMSITPTYRAPLRWPTGSASIPAYGGNAGTGYAAPAPAYAGGGGGRRSYSAPRPASCPNVFRQGVEVSLYFPSGRDMPANGDLERLNQWWLSIRDTNRGKSVSSGALKVMVEGHTDAVGSSASNQALSQRRSERLATFLKGSIIGENATVIPVGRGEALANSNGAANACERRADILVQSV